MLPFLTKKQPQATGIIVKHRAPDEDQEYQDKPDDRSEAIEACAKDLLDAINSSNIKEIAATIKSAFDILSSEDENYDNQNEEAAE